jgi:hypothetical protein
VTSLGATGVGGSNHKESLVLGVTGHRIDLLPAEDIPQLRRTVRTVLISFASSLTGPLTLVSSLAEGADQLVAEEALAVGYRLVSPLPFARDLYEQDFVREESVETFRRILHQASEIMELPGERVTPEADRAAYAKAGQRMLDRVDVLLAIWNGAAARGAGGTAEIIASAGERGLPTVWIRASPPHDVQVLAADEERRATLEGLLRPQIN